MSSIGLQEIMELNGRYAGLSGPMATRPGTGYSQIDLNTTVVEVAKHL